jgi:hypothetical protein
LQRVREEVFRAIGAIYIEPLASRAPLACRESSESFGEGRDVEQKKFEALRHVAIVQ